MKFLCDNCKAKYQIADDKVAGKTVRMKCRKCGHQIEVRAAVTESSVVSQPPRAPSGAPPRPPQKPLATSLSAAKPRATSPSIAPPRGALAGAFTTTVQDAPPASVAQTPADLSVTEEWYVAINGVPVGPVRISELRRRAAKGDVTEESLCWQEGLEEWRPIRSIPELATLVREAAQGNRPSLLAPEPPRVSQPPRAPSAPMAPRASIAPTAPRATSPSIAPTPTRSNVVPLRPAASGGFDDLGGLGAAATAAAVAAPPAPMMTPSAAIAPASDPFALPPPAPMAAPLVAPVPSMAPPQPVAPPPQKSGVPVWFVVVVILVFGSGIGVLLFRSQPAPSQVVIQVPTPTVATTAATPTTAPTDIPPVASADPATPAAPDPKGKTGAVVAKASGAKPAETAEKKGLNLGDLVNNGGGGPSSGPNATPGAGAGGGLDQAGVERVVAGHRAGVKRTCWERGGGDQKSSVNVTITANVAPNGQVASASSSGDDPVVAKCIENQVRTWQFPAPGSATTINIPFKFVRQ